MAKRKHSGSKTVSIDSVEKEFTGMLVDLPRFLDAFKPNGSSGKDYRRYFDSQNDEQYFLDAYMQEDPRLIDYTPEDGYSEEAALELEFPSLSLFAEIAKRTETTAILKGVRICKTYATGCMTAPAHSTVLIKAEADRVRAVMAQVMAK